MLHTHLCDLLGIEVPVIQAAMAGCTSGNLAAAVSNAGGVGTIASALISVEEFEKELASAQELTDRPIAVNHSIPFLNEEAFSITLRARPAVISLALGDSEGLVSRAHDAGIKVMQMVNTVEQAERAAAAGVDIINAQGTEAGGFSGTVSTMTLVPQVVDAVGDKPVVASGGISDGRGLAAAIALGAVGANIGTRFLASEEAPVGEAWKQSIVNAKSEQAIRVPGWTEVFPLTRSGGYDVAPNALPTAFIDKCFQSRGVDEQATQRLSDELMDAVRRGSFYDLVPLTGQTAGAVKSLSMAGDIVRAICSEAEEVLSNSASVVRS